MAYLLDDLYTASGSAKPFGCWTDGVTKFTAASFYNYEQDNLPLFDLEERTHFLWEKFGYPTSSIPGMVLLVSGDAPEEVIACQSNIFLDLSSAVNALPRHLNFPAIIEVASFGDLGDLEITDIQMGPNGSLEIINRLTYDKKIGYRGSFDGSCVSTATGDHADYGNLLKNITSSKVDDYNGLLLFFGNVRGYSPSSLLGISVFSGTDYAYSDSLALVNLDERVLEAYTGFYGVPPGETPYGATLNYEFGRLSVGQLTLPSQINSAQELLVTSVLAEETTTSNLTDYDPSSYNQIEGYSFGSELYRSFTLGLAQTRKVKGVYYGNNINSIKVNSCAGPIYIRGFYCSGDGETSEIGVTVKDSTVYFDNLAVANYIKHGVHIENSNFHVLGSFFVHRCYGLDSNGDRLSKPWLAFNSLLKEAPKDDSAGVYALNSTLIFEDSTKRYQEYLGTKTSEYPSATYKQGNSNTRIVSRNSTGFKLIDSSIEGGRSRELSGITSYSEFTFTDFLMAEGNANYGIDLKNSNISYKGRLEVFGNTRGIKGVNSVILSDEFSIEKNHLYGLYLNNSEFIYGAYPLTNNRRLDFESLNLAYDQGSPKRYSYKLIDNGQHVYAVNSKFDIPSYSYDTPSYFGRLYLKNAHGVNLDRDLAPSIELVNSIGKFIHLTSLREGVESRIAEGSHLLVKDNSQAYILGTASSVCCFLAGYPEVPTYLKTKYYAPLVADDNSTIRFRGPVMIWDGAVGAYAKANSNLIFEPHKIGSESLDINGFNLSADTNHTMIEIKSNRCCLVADKNSNIIMENLGDYHSHWGATDLTNTIYPTDASYLNYQNYTDKGYFQFLPNPNDAEANGAGGISQITYSTRPSTCRMQSAGGNYYWSRDPFNADPYHLSALTQGGLCVKALNGSHVNVKNVHFPCGYWNASSVIYDYTAADAFCSRVFIWNLSNDSTMHARFLSVSGTYPASAGYHGPFAVWTSAANAAAYAAPSSTPDTSTLSVLDYFGSGLPNTWQLPDGTSATYGQGGFFNQGPFRIYRGVDSFANQLYHPGSAPGLVVQLYAQGYNPSGDLSSIPETSGLYGKVLRVSEASGLESSGFYFCNEFLRPNPNSIMLDESAANTFANSKNGAMGTSNRPQICTIYIARNDQYGEGREFYAAALGRGFKSPNIFDILEEN